MASLLPTTIVRERSQEGLTITIEDVGDQLERFLLWAGNLGALKNPNSKLSLDSRLSDALEMREHILRRLSDIDKAVEALQAIVSCDRPNRQIQDSTSTFWLGNENAERPDAEPPTPDIGEFQDDEARMKLGIISKSITMLFSIAIMVRKAGKQDQFFKALQKAEAHQPNELFPDTYDINHVRHKHPKLIDNELESVVQSLGRAITKRRQFIKYRREHVGRLGVNDYQKPSSERPQSKAPVKHAAVSEHQTAKTTVTPNKFKKHLAVHQEQLAIFATPREIGNDARDSESAKSSLPGYRKDRILASVQGAKQTHVRPDPVEVDAYNVPQDREDATRNQQEEEYIVDERYPMHSVDFTGDQSLEEFYSILEKTRGYSTAFAYHKNKQCGFLMSSAADPEVPLVIESLSKFNLEPWKNGIRPKFPMFSMEFIPMLLSEACIHDDLGYFDWAWKHHLVLYPNRKLDDIVWRHMPMLITAVIAGTPEIVKLCIDLGANPNAR
ncbi:hypothetical protein F5X68DRAFT_265709 [Plectosphaerella plurivora]|uniref:Uncharacterized protein n=1 Tax=Plectosphaerella plurivora TaxID=936078 RepID=A0A9P8V2X5_9PEZI|nr:hypothetical protein F5X68DRAFT_265709 [Plectosphaerella plurivora]